MLHDKKKNSKNRVLLLDTLGPAFRRRLGEQLGLFNGSSAILDETFLVIDDGNVGLGEILDLLVGDFPELFSDLEEKRFGFLAPCHPSRKEQEKGWVSEWTDEWWPLKKRGKTNEAIVVPD
jgi:hypothetical protein